MNMHRRCSDSLIYPCWHAYASLLQVKELEYLKVLLMSEWEMECEFVWAVSHSLNRTVVTKQQRDNGVEDDMTCLYDL